MLGGNLRSAESHQLFVAGADGAAVDSRADAVSGYFFYVDCVILRNFLSVSRSDTLTDRMA